MNIDFSKIPSPCYVLDENRLYENLEIIKYIQEQTGAEIILAFKGFAMWNVFPIIRKYINGAAASSLNEAILAFEEMKTLAHTYSPVYIPEEFKDIIKYSSYITFNSLNQFEKFYTFIQKSNKKVSVGLRINPEYSDVTTNLYNPCSPGSRLGILAYQLPEKLPEPIDGLHFHNLCESGSDALENTLKVFIEKFEKYFSQIKWVNFGGGHLMTRKGYKIEHLIKIIRDFKNRYNLHVILEPGAAFVWETGYLVSKIQDIVENKSIKTAILDVSFAAHMPDCLEMPYKPKISGAYDENKGKYTYRMGGNSCLAGDFVGNWSFDRELQIGDQIIFEDMIHYTMVKTTMFNGVKHPSIGIWNEKRGFKLIRKFGYEDYKNRLS